MATRKRSEGILMSVRRTGDQKDKKGDRKKTWTQGDYQVFTLNKCQLSAQDETLNGQHGTTMLLWVKAKGQCGFLLIINTKISARLVSSLTFYTSGRRLKSMKTGDLKSLKHPNKKHQFYMYFTDRLDVMICFKLWQHLKQLCEANLFYHNLHFSSFLSSTPAMTLHPFWPLPLISGPAVGSIGLMHKQYLRSVSIFGSKGPSGQLISPVLIFLLLIQHFF